MSPTEQSSRRFCKIKWLKISEYLFLLVSRALKAHFDALEKEDDRGINEARGYACEIVAWRFVTNLTLRECIDYLLFDLPPSEESQQSGRDTEEGFPWGHSNGQNRRPATAERTPLLSGPPLGRNRNYHHTSTSNTGADRIDTGLATMSQADDFAANFLNLNSLEIAAVSGAKKFLSQRVIQRIVGDICKFFYAQSGPVCVYEIQVNL